MRLVTYNILDGGEGRAEALTQVIASQRPDIVCLVEADNLDVVERVARELRMDFVLGEGHGHSVAILSHWPIVETVNHGALRPKPRCLTEATVRGPGGEEWVVAAVHFRARATEEREKEREAELAEVLKVFEGRRVANRSHLLAGDFNANSPIQEIDPQKLSPRSREAWDAQGGQIPRRVIRQLLEAGYVDPVEVVHPAEAGRIVSFTTEHPGQRVDYVFTYGVEPSRIKAAWVEQGDLARRASDHFSVGVEIA